MSEVNYNSLVVYVGGGKDLREVLCPVEGTTWKRKEGVVVRQEGYLDGLDGSNKNPYDEGTPNATLWNAGNALGFETRRAGVMRSEVMEH